MLPVGVDVPPDDGQQFGRLVRRQLGYESVEFGVHAGRLAVGHGIDEYRNAGSHAVLSGRSARPRPPRPAGQYTGKTA